MVHLIGIMKYSFITELPWRFNREKIRDDIQKTPTIIRKALIRTV